MAKLGSTPFSKTWLNSVILKDDRQAAKVERKKARDAAKATRLELAEQLAKSRAECRALSRPDLDAADQALDTGIGALRGVRRAEKKKIRSECAVDKILADVQRATSRINRRRARSLAATPLGYERKTAATFVLSMTGRRGMTRLRARL